MKQAKLFLIALVIAATGTLVMAQHPGAMNDDGPMLMPGLERMLDLTDEQAAKIADMRLDLQKKILPLRSDLMQKRNDLKVLLTADNPDQSKIDKTIEAMNDIRTDMQKQRLDNMMKVRSLLNADQKKKMDMHILSGRKGMKGGHHRMMMKNHPPMKRRAK